MTHDEVVREVERLLKEKPEECFKCLDKIYQALDLKELFDEYMERHGLTDFRR